MAQIKIYGLRDHLEPIRCEFSAVVHEAIRTVLQLPPQKRFHRFFLMDRDDYIMPGGKSDKYTIIEISMFEGRTVNTKKELIRALYEVTARHFNYTAEDLEITIFETPQHNWGIRGLPADELGLNYRVDI